MHKNPLSRGFRETTYNALFWRTPAHHRVQSELVRELGFKYHAGTRRNLEILERVSEYAPLTA